MKLPEGWFICAALVGAVPCALFIDFFGSYLWVSTVVCGTVTAIATFVRERSRKRSGKVRP